MKKMFSFVLISTLLLFSVIPADQVSAESLVTLDETVMIEGESYKATQTVNGSVVTTTLVGAEETVELVRVADEFTSLETDFMSPKEEARNLDIINRSSVEVQQAGYTETKVVYNKWRYGTWKNYHISTADRTTVVILTTLILSKIPYVGGIAAAMAGIYLAYNMKTGYFKAKKDTMLLPRNYIKQKQHLKLFKNSDYTGLISYKTAIRTEHMAD